MATLFEHAQEIREAIKAARAAGYRLSLECGDDYEVAYVDLESYTGACLTDWETIVERFD
jgi:hypothetical protein